MSKEQKKKERKQTGNKKQQGNNKQENKLEAQKPQQMKYYTWT